MATPTNLPAAAVAGEILTASYVNNLRGAFRVLQVIQGTTTTTTTCINNTFKDTTLTASITPQSTSSKILVVVFQNGCAKSAVNVFNSINLQLMRGATVISSMGTAVGYSQAVASNNIAANIGTISTMYLDSPATVSATTYKTQFANQGNDATVTVQDSSAMSTITLFEISA